MGFGISITELIGRPMTPTPMEIRSCLAPEDFERALRGVPAIIERSGSPYLLHARRVRSATVETSGHHVEIHFRSAPIWDLRKGYERGSLYVQADLTGRVVPVDDGALLSVDLTTLSRAARGLVRLTPIVTASGALATLAAAVLVPALVVIPAVVATGGASSFVVGCVGFRLSRRQKADEIARMLLVVSEATRSTTTAVLEAPGRGITRPFEPWLRDVPGSMIVDEMHRLADASGQP
jgi:hypothetical protein